MLHLESRSRFRRQDGQGTVEYGVLIGFGALLVILSMLYLAANIDGLVRDTGRETNAPTSQPVRVVGCDAGYSGACIPPPPPDLDCLELAARGVSLPVRVVGRDSHNLDPDGDGRGC
jgi:Flp pilus assembly pilin Flp